MTNPVEVPESRYADVDGLSIHYKEIGTGTPLIMLHGTGPGASGWSNFRQTVPAFSDRYRVIVPDLPRYGKSSKIAIRGPRLTLLSGIMVRFMDAVGAQKAHFIGNSMGGQVAMKLAIDHPDRVGRLVVIGSPPLKGSSVSANPAEGIRMIEGYYKGGGPTRDKMAAIVRALVFDQKFATEEVIQARYEDSVLPEVIAANDGPLWEREHLEGQLERLTAPIMLVWGQDDRFAQLDLALRMVRELANARLLLLSRCGHWAQVEHANEFNSSVRNFFETALGPLQR
jgi:4,5:9,10-diseco-3-hydroxy-5,9,17-trioxoandrosta-1(10),2-diene-4-oate hydrolase